MARLRNTGIHDQMSWQRLLDEWFGTTKFDVVVRRLVDKMNRQLKDSFAVQKIYDGTAASSVWSGRSVRHYSKTNNFQGGYTVVHNWHEESLWRKQNDSSGKRWYSTGKSHAKTLMEIENDDLAHGVFVLNTTFGLLMSEMGLGANGYDAVRGKGSKGRRGIKVQRDKDYTPKRRYVPDWVPGQGHAHRPTAKRQFGLLRRAIANFAMEKYQYKVASWIVYDLAHTILNGVSRDLHATFDAYGHINISVEVEGTDIKKMPEPKS